MTRVKLYSNQQLSELEKSINEFLKKEEVKQLINIKFCATNRDNSNEYTALIIYEENMTLGKEDPQMYE
ncbi:MAG TPA: sporulation protein Cse60 [Candidatus Nitrosocosmicus sp.]|nr:sporulation protein Cse60 [Candidatus Nitrosocosmicus sp.]